MVRVDVEYTGNLHCDATHGPSKSKLATDAPTDNKGRGEAFSPTDLVATALGTCISTTMGIKAESLGVDLRGMKVSVQKEMSTDAPRRIVALPSEVHIPLPPDSPHREILEQTALNCPVHKSLPPEIRRPTKFFWEGEAATLIPGKATSHNLPRRFRARTAADSRARPGLSPNPLG